MSKRRYYEEFNIGYDKDFVYSHYTGQDRDLRDLAIEELGAEKVAKMGDSEITKHFQKKELVPLSIHFEHGIDYQQVFLIPLDELVKYKRLERYYKND